MAFDQTFVTRRLAAVAVGLMALLLAIGGCSAQSGVTTGVVTAVNGDLATVRSFTVFDDGQQYEFVPSPDGDYAFPLPHLLEHLRDGDPVTVRWGVIDGVRTALAVDDA